MVTAPNAPLTARAKAGSVLRPRAAVSAIRCCSSPSDPPSSPSAQPPRRRGSRTGAWTEAQQRAYALINEISWDDMFYRSDIGYRAIQREE